MPHVPTAPHALDLLKREHREVEALFARWEQGQDDPRSTQIVSEICQALTIHAQVEEEIFYPRALALADEDTRDLIFEAAVEHGTLKGLISRLDGSRHADEAFRAYVAVLRDYVAHHVREEEDVLFPALASCGLDWQALGADLLARKEDLEDEVAQRSEAAEGMVSIVRVDEFDLSDIAPAPRRAA